jgi:hypothetical protein
MIASDVAKLPSITTALTDLRNQGLAIQVEVLVVQMTVNGKPVQYAWDTGSGEWQIAAQ